MQTGEEKLRAKSQLKEAKDTLAQTRKEIRYAETVVVAAEAVKVYSLEELGHGNKKGGTKQHQKARMDVLDRVRSRPSIRARGIFSRHLGIARCLISIWSIGRGSSRR